jgi:ParB/RepB/Spo0J family partition protein
MAETEKTELEVAEATGNGKKATSGIKGIAKGRSDTYRIKPEDIHVKEGFNSRVVNFDPTDAEDLALAQSIAQIGVKQPVTVFWEEGKAWLSDGHRRHAASLFAIANIAGVDPELTMPVQTESREADEAERIFSQIVRNTGKPFTALEQASVFKKLLALNWTEQQIADKSGISKQRVSDLMGLQKAPAKIKKMIQKGEISATLAITTLKKTKGDTAKAVEALSTGVTKAKEEGKTKATAKHVPDVKPDNPKVRLRAIFGEIVFQADGEDYTASFTADEYAEIRTLIGF